MHIERRNKKRKKLPEISKLSDAKECASQKLYGNRANINSNLLALELAAEPQL